MRKFISIHCLCNANVTIMRNFWHGKTDKFPIEHTPTVIKIKMQISN
jgi:hypothetical protein